MLRLSGPLLPRYGSITRQGERAQGPSPPSLRLPDGFVARLEPSVRRLGIAPDGREVLLGGSPPAIVRLAPRASQLLRDGDVRVTDDLSAALARRLTDAGLARPRPPAGPPPAVTVVIPVRDNPAGLDRLLRALLATSQPAEVIVTDDGSADAAAVRTVTRRHAARLLRRPVAGGPAAARNAGLAAAVTPLVAFCDSDVVPDRSGWLDELCAHFADPAVALVAPRIVGLPPAVPGPITRYEAVRSSLDLGPIRSRIRPDTAVSYVPSAAVVVRADAVAGGFDPELRVAEDVDLVFRLHAAGWRMRYEPDVRVAHEHRTGLRPWLTRKAFYGTGAAPLALRHPGLVPPMRLAPWTAVACGAVLAQRRWSAPVAAALTVVAALRLRRTLRGVPRAGLVSVRLAGDGLAGALRQTASAMLRHWWPVAAVGCLASRRARRAVLVAALAEAAADWWRRGRDVPLVEYGAAHRLDDLAYGAGLWWGCARQRTVRPLLPVLVRRGKR